MSETRNNDRETGVNQLWGGRFAAGPAEIMTEINASIDFDVRLYRQDISGSRAHCNMLLNCGIIDKADAHAILNGLDQIETEITDGNFTFSRALEDIHMNVESRLRELIGPAAGRLHTARSRNDQVATDFRLWVRDAVDALDLGLAALQDALLDKADAHTDAVMPGFTHLQSAQPVTFGHHMMAYYEMIDRDRDRLQSDRKRMNLSPLGAAALAGTSFPIDRQQTAAALGFDGPMRNSLDAVSDRDFALDYLSSATILAMHLSRLAEELVIWSSAQFAFVRLSDSFSTGSSIMPQKRNPDAAELVRGKIGRISGAFIALTTMMKGLPLTYSKDMQEDKEPVFDVADSLALIVPAMTGMIRDLTVNAPAMAAAAGSGFATATDLADWLVRCLGLPFRDAHHITGELVHRAEQRQIGLSDLTLEEMQDVEPGITEDIFNVLTVEASVKSRVSDGGTAPDQVRKAIQAAKKRRAKT